MSNRGIVLVPVIDGHEAREVCELIAGGPTYAIERGPVLEVFADDSDGWFRPAAFTMTNAEFLRRFGANTPTPTKERSMPLLTMLTTAATKLGLAADPDPNRSKREALPSRATVAVAAETAERAALACREAVAKVRNFDKVQGYEKEFGDTAVACETNLRRLQASNAERRNYGPPALVKSHRNACDQFKEVTQKRIKIIEQLKADANEYPKLKTLLDSTTKNRGLAPNSASTERESEIAENRMNTLLSGHDRLREQLVENEADIRQAYLDRQLADDALSDFCDSPRREVKPVEAYFKSMAIPVELARGLVAA